MCEHELVCAFLSSRQQDSLDGEETNLVDEGTNWLLLREAIYQR